MNSSATPDLIRELRAIEKMAKKAQRAIASGSAKNGNTALAQIQHRASDAVRWAGAPLVEEDGDRA